MYALLAKKPPFHGRSLPETIHAVKFADPTPLRRLNSDVPPELEAVVMQLLEKDPQKRPATAVVLSNRLKEVWSSIKEGEASAKGRRQDRGSFAADAGACDSIDGRRGCGSQSGNRDARDGV